VTVDTTPSEAAAAVAAPKASVRDRVRVQHRRQVRQDRIDEQSAVERKQKRAVVDVVDRRAGAPPSRIAAAKATRLHVE
jgi:hypothetical protein